MLELKIIIVLLLGPLFLIQAAHVFSHKTYCRSEMEWAREYGLNKDDLYRLRQELNN